MSKKTKKAMSMLLVVTLIAVIAIGGMLAYLTDRDSEANVFTVGNVDIELNEVFDEDNATLKPGVEVEKIPTVKNVGKNDAWVWTTVAVPKALDEYVSFVGKTSDWEWLEGREETIEGIEYVVYPVLHNNALKAGAETEELFTAVKLDENIDITPEGKWYHVEGGVTTDLAWNNEKPVVHVGAFAIQTEEFKSVQEAHNAYYVQWGEEGKLVPVSWDGTADKSWYNDEDTEFTIKTPEQLAGFAELVDDGKTFEGKTVKLGSNIDLYAVDANGERVSFDPIGSYRNDTSFKGTFDGQNYTIKNLSQNTWALDNGYYYTDCGLGLFGAVEDGAVKNLIMDGASISGESALCGVVAAAAHNAAFENIVVKNSEIADYQYYAGGIVGWASGKTSFNGCNVDETTTVAAQWGDFDNSTGGVIGGASGSAEILIKDTTVSCRIDAYNDVTSSYQWYAYRRCGMLIGNSGKTKDVNGTTYADAPQLTCDNVDVIYDDWANYTYCEFAGTSWPYVRVQAGVSNSAYSNPRYGHPTDANGNQVVDDNHVHNAGEDHFIECTFDQLYGGGQGVYGTATHDGVTIVYNNK